MLLTLNVLVSAGTGAEVSAWTSPLVAGVITPVFRKRPIASRGARSVGAVPRSASASPLCPCPHIPCLMLLPTLEVLADAY